MKSLFLLLTASVFWSTAHKQSMLGAQTSAPASSTIIESRPATSPAYDKPPSLYYAPDPKFSEQARAAHFSGSVLLRVHITAAGDVDKATVIRGVGYGLDEEAENVASQYRFRPALKADVAVACELVIEVKFVLRS